LAARGFTVNCSALLARIPPCRPEPDHWLERRLFDQSQRWLFWATRNAGYFHKMRWAAGLVPRFRHSGHIRLFLDSLYVLFYGAPDKGVVLVYDVTPVTHQDWHQTGVCHLYETAYRQLARSRCHLVASCQNTADHLRVNWGIAPSRVTVLPLASLSEPPAADHHPVAAEPFFLFVGTLEPRKNVAGLIKGYRASGLFASTGIRLRIIGSLLREEDEAVVLARSTPGVDYRGFVDPQELAASYAQCLAFVYPSFCEGFGLPLLEAMERGCVCLSTKTGASPEVAGGAAMYVNPYAIDDIAAGLRRLAFLPEGEREVLQAKARQRAASFTWDRFHDGLATVLREAATT
jgi:glycosyltransferase involved in cell wall biosynthesis